MLTLNLYVIYHKMTEYKFKLLFSLVFVVLIYAKHISPFIRDSPPPPHPPSSKQYPITMPLLTLLVTN